MSIREDIDNQYKQSIRDKNSDITNTLRLVKSAIKDKDISTRSASNKEGIGDSEILSLLLTLIKQRKDSISELLCNIKDVESNSFNQTLDSLTKELLKPLLKEWLDNNLPTIVDHIVRITSVSSK